MSNHKVKVEKDGAERWLLTYADLMNLLLIFFIVLYSMSQVDTQKFNKLASSFKAAFGEYNPGAIIGSGGAGDAVVPPPFITTPKSTPNGGTTGTEAQQMEEIKERLDELIKSQNLSGSVEVSIEERGVEVSITERFLFKSGNAIIEPDAIPLLEIIGKMLHTLPANNIRIEGHTDNDPINTFVFPSNWELSSLRATNVLKLLVDKAKVNPSFISAVGYGEYRPKLPNDTIAHKAANRRVDIVIVKNMYNTTEAAKP